jgi:hypothetical protein
MVRQVHEIEAVAWQRQGVYLDQFSAPKFVADDHVAADGDSLSRNNRVDRVQFLAEAGVRSPVDIVDIQKASIDRACCR